LVEVEREVGSVVDLEAEKEEDSVGGSAEEVMEEEGMVEEGMEEETEEVDSVVDLVVEDLVVVMKVEGMEENLVVVHLL
jgi:hypothetical protein